MMKSRKEKTTRKRGLTSEEYIDKLNESKPDKNEWKELLKIAMETRKFEIELYWKRANYFWLFVAAFFVAYYQTIPSENKQTEVENILFIVGGYFFSIGWYLANRGSKYWQENWEKHIAVLSRHLKTPIFELLKSNENKIWELSKSYPYSVSRINQGLNIVVIFIWLVLFIYRIYSFGFYPFITTPVAVVILFVVTRYALHFARSFVVREPTDHSKDFFLNDKVQIHKRE
ncbi:MULTISPECIES: RipA family octameric membrane protein [Bacteroidales]|uniref:RipA family octameric membrane protein n=1 Tax=Bacteroidales TaxID=171549 RepID=UPI00321B1AC4